MPITVNPAQPEDVGYQSSIMMFSSEMLKLSAATVRSCEGYSNIEPTMRAVSGGDTLLVPKGRSRARMNEMGRVAEIMHAHLTDTRPSTGYRTYNTEFESYATDMGKMWTIWYYNRAIDAKFGQTIDYALVAGSGYAHQFYDRQIRDINVLPYDGRDVLPVDPIGTELQSCYGTFLRRSIPLVWAQAMFPYVADALERDSVWEPPTKLPEITRDDLLRSRGIEMSPFDRARMDTKPEEKRNAVQVVYMYWFYFNDPTLNTSKREKLVGDFGEDEEPLTNYSYRVPMGEPVYPRKRLLIRTESVRCYDGPSHYWHGMFPVSKHTVMPWPWTWLGTTPLWDCLQLQESMTFTLRVLDDHVRKLIRPPVSGDRLTSEETLKKISEMLALPGAVWRNMSSATPVKVEQVQPLDAAWEKLFQISKRGISERCGIEDVDSLMQLGQMPEGDSLDKLLFAGAPASRLRSRMLELFYREQGRMFFFNRMQFTSTRQRFRMLGRDSMKPQDYLFDPATWVPRFADGAELTPIEAASTFGDQFEFFSEPSSLLRTAAAAGRAEALALYRMKALPLKTLLDKLDYRNVNEIMELRKQEMMEQLQMAAQIQAATAGPAAGGNGSGNGSAVGPDGKIAGFSPEVNGNPQGRKPEGTDNPRLNSSGYLDFTH